MTKKRGQLTLFIIIGIVAIVIVLFALYLYNPNLFKITPPTAQPDTFEYCAKKGVDNIILELAPTAGFTGSYFNKTYMNVAVPYVCYSDEYYKPCVVQAPFLENVFIESLSERINEQVQKCYDNYVEEFQRQGYEVKQGKIGLEMALQKDKIKLDITAPLSVTDSDSTSTFQDFSFDIPTKLYAIIMMANNIVQFETTYGEYELVKSQLLYPDMPVNAFKLGDGTVIYRINSKDIKYQFAVRSFVFPPGYGV